MGRVEGTAWWRDRVARDPLYSSLLPPSLRRELVTLVEEPKAVVLPLLPLHPSNVGGSGGLHRCWEVGDNSEVECVYRGWEESVSSLDREPSTGYHTAPKWAIAAPAPPAASLTFRPPLGRCFLATSKVR